MGTYAHAELVSRALLDEIDESVLRPTLVGLRKACARKLCTIDSKA